MDMNRMILRTRRLVLRPWRESDAAALYRYARDPRVGPPAGWLPHTGLEESRAVIRDVLSADGTFAVVPKGRVLPVGSVGLTVGTKDGEIPDPSSGEIGYWIGVPYWGRGLVPEAVRALLRLAFQDLNLSAVWCGYYDGNEKSRRVQEKCGFRYHHTEEERYCPLLGETRTEHFSRITKEEWFRTAG